MSFYVDVDYSSLNKFKEELCGDKVEILRSEHSVIVVLADGLGSGVKANILATLTSKIIGTMLSMGATIDEAVDTIIETLPVCKVRELAYSTFSILQIFDNGECYLIEFDNPEAIRLVKGKHVELQKEIREIDGKRIKESRFIAGTGDTIMLISDGAVHAGVGQCLNLGWQWEHVKNYAEKIHDNEATARGISKLMTTACDNLYEQKPGDDTTVICVRLKNRLKVNVLIGPPIDRALDQYVISKFIEEDGKKVVCGGTTSAIVGRITGKEISTDFNYIDPSIPPTANIDGIDLTTEGVLTMCKALDYVKNYISADCNLPNLKNHDGASRLTRLLVEDSTEVHFIVGRAINPAHQNPDFPIGLGMKLKLVQDMEKYLQSLGKKVEVEYY